MLCIISAQTMPVQVPYVTSRSGYMAPEYAMNGYLSAKTDVFSFGILVLEIVSGRKNIVRHLDDEKVDLLSYVSAPRPDLLVRKRSYCRIY